MAADDVLEDAIERLECDERRDEHQPGGGAGQLTRRTALTGGAAVAAALMLQACGSSSSLTAAASVEETSAAVFGSNDGPLHFTFVNHAVNDPFFIPTQRGAADACKLLGATHTWTGSTTSNPTEMINAINSAITADTDGIATSLVTPSAFDSPVQAALNANIPVVSYYADVPSNPRLAYIGQDRFAAGVAMGERIHRLIPKGRVALFVADPHSADIAPRLLGVESVLRADRRIELKVVRTSTETARQTASIETFVGLNQSYRGFFGLDAQTTKATARAIKRYYLAARGVRGGGFDLTPATAKLLADGQITFAIDQQPYLQGFLPILQLYMYKVSEGLTGIADTDTGMRFIDETSIEPFARTRSAYEGTSTQAGVQAA